jgi:hypothetical protein
VSSERDAQAVSPTCSNAGSARAAHDVHGVVLSASGRAGELAIELAGTQARREALQAERDARGGDL